MADYFGLYPLIKDAIIWVKKRYLKTQDEYLVEEKLVQITFPETIDKTIVEDDWEFVWSNREDVESRIRTDSYKLYFQIDDNNQKKSRFKNKSDQVLLLRKKKN